MTILLATARLRRLTVTTAYPITVGAGGGGGNTPGGNGSNGSNSTFSTITSAGGGGGHTSNVTPYAANAEVQVEAEAVQLVVLVR